MAMSQNLNSVIAYGYWKAHMHFFLKFIDVWRIVESGWTKLEDTTELITKKKRTTSKR
jgi:hypothetical protein